MEPVGAVDVPAGFFYLKKSQLLAKYCNKFDESD